MSCGLGLPVPAANESLDCSGSYPAASLRARGFTGSHLGYQRGTSHWKGISPYLQDQTVAEIQDEAFDLCLQVLPQRPEELEEGEWIWGVKLA